MSVSPYIFFDGCCKEAITFYKSVLGAEVEMLMRFGEAPPNGDMKLPPGSENKIMHASMKIGGSQVMASDGMCSGNPPSIKGCALSIDVPDPATAGKVFHALSAGGEVQQPLTETFFASRFGMVADKFGVSWMVVAAPQG